MKKLLIEDLHEAANEVNKVNSLLNRLSNRFYELQSHDDLTRLKNIEFVLTEVLNKLKLESANFSRINSPNDFPKNEKEVDSFIKNRIELWLNTWIAGPIKSVLDHEEKKWL